jgi:hypothetical protein
VCEENTLKRKMEGDPFTEELRIAYRAVGRQHRAQYDDPDYDFACRVDAEKSALEWFTEIIWSCPTLFSRFKEFRFDLFNRQTDAIDYEYIFRSALENPAHLQRFKALHEKHPIFPRVNAMTDQYMLEILRSKQRYDKFRPCIPGSDRFVYLAEKEWPLIEAFACSLDKDLAYLISLRDNRLSLRAFVRMTFDPFIEVPDKLPDWYRVDTLQRPIEFPSRFPDTVLYAIDDLNDIMKETYGVIHQGAYQPHRVEIGVPNPKEDARQIDVSNFEAGFKNVLKKKTDSLMYQTKVMLEAHTIFIEDPNHAGVGFEEIKRKLLELLRLFQTRRSAALAQARLWYESVYRPKLEDYVLELERVKRAVKAYQVALKNFQSQKAKAKTISMFVKGALTQYFRRTLPTVDYGVVKKARFMFPVPKTSQLLDHPHAEAFPFGLPARGLGGRVEAPAGLVGGARQDLVETPAGTFGGKELKGKERSPPPAPAARPVAMAQYDFLPDTPGGHPPEDIGLTLDDIQRINSKRSGQDPVTLHGMSPGQMSAYLIDKYDFLRKDLTRRKEMYITMKKEEFKAPGGEHDNKRVAAIELIRNEIEAEKDRDRVDIQYSYDVEIENTEKLLEEIVRAAPRDGGEEEKVAEGVVAARNARQIELEERRRSLPAQRRAALVRNDQKYERLLAKRLAELEAGFETKATDFARDEFDKRSKRLLELENSEQQKGGSVTLASHQFVGGAAGGGAAKATSGGGGGDNLSKIARIQTFAKAVEAVEKIGGKSTSKPKDPNAELKARVDKKALESKLEKIDLDAEKVSFEKKQLIESMDTAKKLEYAKLVAAQENAKAAAIKTEAQEAAAKRAAELHDAASEKARLDALHAAQTNNEKVKNLQASTRLIETKEVLAVTESWKKRELDEKKVTEQLEQSKKNDKIKNKNLEEKTEAQMRLDEEKAKQAEEMANADSIRKERETDANIASKFTKASEREATVAEQKRKQDEKAAEAQKLKEKQQKEKLEEKERKDGLTRTRMIEDYLEDLQKIEKSINPRFNAALEFTDFIKRLENKVEVPLTNLCKALINDMGYPKIAGVTKARGDFYSSINKSVGSMRTSINKFISILTVDKAVYSDDEIDKYLVENESTAKSRSEKKLVFESLLLTYKTDSVIAFTSLNIPRDMMIREGFLKPFKAFVKSRVDPLKNVKDSVKEFEENIIQSIRKDSKYFKEEHRAILNDPNSTIEQWETIDELVELLTKMRDLKKKAEKIKKEIEWWENVVLKVPDAVHAVLTRNDDLQTFTQEMDMRLVSKVANGDEDERWGFTGKDIAQLKQKYLSSDDYQDSERIFNLKTELKKKHQNLTALQNDYCVTLTKELKHELFQVVHEQEEEEKNADDNSKFIKDVADDLIQTWVKTVVFDPFVKSAYDESEKILSSTFSIMVDLGEKDATLMEEQSLLETIGDTLVEKLLTSGKQLLVAEHKKTMDELNKLRDGVNVVASTVWDWRPDGQTAKVETMFNLLNQALSTLEQVYVLVDAVNTRERNFVEEAKAHVVKLATRRMKLSTLGEGREVSKMLDKAKTFIENYRIGSNSYFRVMARHFLKIVEEIDERLKKINDKADIGLGTFFREKVYSKFSDFRRLLSAEMMTRSGESYQQFTGGYQTLRNYLEENTNPDVRERFGTEFAKDFWEAFKGKEGFNDLRRLKAISKDAEDQTKIATKRDSVTLELWKAQTDYNVDHAAEDGLSALEAIKEYGQGNDEVLANRANFLLGRLREVMQYTVGAGEFLKDRKSAYYTRLFYYLQEFNQTNDPGNYAIQLLQGLPLQTYFNKAMVTRACDLLFSTSVEERNYIRYDRVCLAITNYVKAKRGENTIFADNIFEETLKTLPTIVDETKKLEYYANFVWFTLNVQNLGGIKKNQVFPFPPLDYFSEITNGWQSVQNWLEGEPGACSSALKAWGLENPADFIDLPEIRLAYPFLVEHLQSFSDPAYRKHSIDEIGMYITMATVSTVAARCINLRYPEDQDPALLNGTVPFVWSNECRGILKDGLVSMHERVSFAE